MSIPSPLPAYLSGGTPPTNAAVISFVKTDPLGCGVTAAASGSPGNDTAIESVVNVVSANYPVPASPMTAADFEELFDATEFSTFTSAVEQQLQLMFTAGVINVGDAPVQSQLNALFTNYPRTLAAVQGKYTRPGSAWEYWFGAGSQATNSILDQARNSGSGNNF